MTRPRARHIREAARPQGRVLAVATLVLFVWLLFLQI
jgi:hypothetical protein